MDYQKFRDDFLASGMTQKAYAAHIGKSPAMVHYYLQRAKAQGTAASTPWTPKFSELLIEGGSTRSVIKIRTAAGLLIEIPV